MPSEYPRSNEGRVQEDPAMHAEAITPADTDLAYFTRGVYVGGAGTLVVVMRSGSTVTIPAVAAGVMLPIQASQIKAATTATSITALY